MCALFGVCWLDFFFIFTGHVSYPYIAKTNILIFLKIQYGRHNMSKNIFYRLSGLLKVMLSTDKGNYNIKSKKSKCITYVQTNTKTNNKIEVIVCLWNLFVI